jgi:hypothetical protein
VPEGRIQAARRRALQRVRPSRAAVLELAVRAEYAMDESLANDLAADDHAAAVLQEHMTWRVPIEVKLKLLEQAMDSRDLIETFPFIIPVLTMLFQIRNILAHSLETPAESEHEIAFLSARRGRITKHSLRIDALKWLQQQGNEVFDELLIVSSALRDLRVYEEEEEEEESQLRG